MRKAQITVIMTSFEEILNRHAKNTAKRMISKWWPLKRRYVRFKIHSFHAYHGPSIKFRVQSLNIIMSCSEIRQSLVLFMPSSCLISDLFKTLTYYCWSQEGEYGEMIACDNVACPIEWFHFACLGLTAAPAGRWYVPTVKIATD